jgi:hypothetical protein
MRITFAISRIGQPVFPRGRQGLANMARLRSGGMLVKMDRFMTAGSANLLASRESAFRSRIGLEIQRLRVHLWCQERKRPDFDIIIEALIPTPISK